MPRRSKQHILITGIPGMGKTTIGNFLMSEKGFSHLDMETHPEEHRLLHTSQEDFMRLVVGAAKDFVITFGFYPPHCTSDILYLKDQGFTLIWLDGNRDAAYKSYKARVEREDSQNLEQHIRAFHAQIERIESTEVIKEISPVIVNSFDDAGDFRQREDIAQEILTEVTKMRSSNR